MTLFEKRQLEIAKKTVRMPDAMVFVLGGMTKEEARKIIEKYTSNISKDANGDEKNGL